MQVLVVEDDDKMATLLRQALEEEGYHATVVGDGSDALAIARAAAFDVIVLDVLLPRRNGFEVVRSLRDQAVRTPVLMLTARDAVSDVVSGLNAGADDYMTKPFAVDELLARVRAAARRGPAAQPPVLRVADLALDPGARRVARGDRKIALTRTEFSLLETLMRRAGQVVTRETLIQHVWGYDADVENNTLDAFVRLLRARIDEPGAPRLIHTVRGVGYRIGADEQ